MQPAYLPWLGYFDRVSKSDLFIVLDHVSMDNSSKNKFANRNKIRTHQGWSWLTIPIQGSGSSQDIPLNELHINNSFNWRKKHFKSIQSCYQKSPFYSQHESFLHAVYDREWPTLFSLVDILILSLATLDIKTPVVYSSSLEPVLSKSQLF